MLQHPVNNVEELVHDGSDDDDLWLTLRFETCCKFFTDRIKAHGGHGGKEQMFTELAVACFAHGRAGFSAGTRLKVSWRDSCVGRQFATSGEVAQVG